MSIPIDIATALKTALAAVIPEGTNLFADGVLDTAGVDKDPYAPPLVAIMVSECMPQQYRSVLRDYPVMIYAETTQPDDKDQAVIYALGAVVSAWLCEPSLTLTLAHFDSLTIEAAPERNTVGLRQYFAWSCMVHTRKLTS